MNKDIIKGNWKQLKGKLKEKWGKLTDDDFTAIDGKREQLLGKLQQKYGYAKDQAERELSTWEKNWERENLTSSGASSSKNDFRQKH